MISKILYEGKITDKNNYLYTDQFLSYLILSELDRNTGAKVGEVHNHIANFIPDELIKRNQIQLFLKQNCRNEKTNWYLTSQQVKHMAKLSELRSLYEEELCNSDKTKLLRASRVFTTKGRKRDSILASVAAFEQSVNETIDEEQMAKLLYLISNYEELASEAKSLIEGITSFFDEWPLELIVDDKTALKLLAFNNLTTVGDLKAVDANKIVLAFSQSIDSFLNAIEAISKEYHNFFHDFYDSFFSCLTERGQDIFRRRNNYFEAPETLDQIGQEYNLTRERVRQIEHKATDKLCKQSQVINKIMVALFSKLEAGKNYVQLNELIQLIQEIEGADEKTTQDIINLLLCVVDNSDISIKYDKEAKVLYDSDSTSIENLIEEIIQYYGKTIMPSVVEEMDNFERYVLDNNYKKIQSGVYLLKSLAKRILFTDIIAENFQEGFRVSDQGDYEEAKRLFEVQYGYSDDYPRPNALRGMLEREGFVLCDRGTVIAGELAPTLSKAFVNKIINYVIKHGPVVYYRSVFDVFREDLSKRGITNHYYLKGCLDLYLTEDINTHRDYLSVGEKDMTPEDAIVSFMESFDGEFEMQDLRERFPNIEEYVFLNYVYGEEENGLLFSAEKTFIYFDKLNIRQESIDELRSFVEKQFEASESVIISARKVYAILSIRNKQLLQQLHLTHGYYTLFSVIRYCFMDDYYFRRPLISKEPIEGGRYAIIRNHAERLDSFNQQMITSFAEKMNIGGLYSYLDFMEDLSEDFVQVDIGTMIRKEVLNIPNSTIDGIKNVIDLIVEKDGEIKTEHFKAYQIFPKIPNRNWNKYLLAGIVRTYLNESFEIENTTNMYSSTDFIIRRA